MLPFHQDALKELIEFKGGPAVSIYIPTQEVSSLSDEQDRIRFKNAIDQAGLRLQDYGIAAGNADLVLGEARQLIDDKQFWSHQSHGLAVFMAPDFFRAYRLPIDFDEHVLVNHRFHIPPLMPFFEGLRPFFVLAFSQQEVKLFKANRLEINEVPQEEMPHSIQEILRDFEFSKELLHYQSAIPGSVMVQQGEETYSKKEQLATFCRRIDQALQDMLQATKAPLVLACVDYISSIYRNVSKYPLIMDQTISGNPIHTHPKELLRQALEIVEPMLTRDCESALAHFAELSDTDRIVYRTADVVKAAYGSQIETLFLLSDIGPRGELTQEGKVEMHADKRLLDEDLVNLATIYTLQNGGRVFSIEPGELQAVMPVQLRGAGEVAAILRWA